ncbi:hypothetical protein FSP39_007798 [Pinctada imbricata]|uniref:Uncharacterized protein n=1 Tax=Pinctada imbricata TaxID=66713 RepID=A0AA88XQM4_PINIB|nr:hypothetical protein FSP39_007798 [Pinctada imbricata]
MDKNRKTNQKNNLPRGLAEFRNDLPDRFLIRHGQLDNRLCSTLCFYDVIVPNRLCHFDVLFEELTGAEKYGPINRVWLSPGHVFVSIREGKQLFTFDNKPTNKVQEESFGCLDINDLTSPLLDIILDPNNSNLVYLIQCDGHVRCWKFRSDLTWVHIRNFSLCNDQHTEVISVCLHPTHNALYWCELQNDGENGQSLCRVSRRNLPKDEREPGDRDYNKVETILYNSTPCQVYALQTGIAIVLRNNLPLVSMVILWQPSSTSVTVCMGPYRTEVKELVTSQAIDFVNIALKCFGLTSKMKDKPITKRIVYNTPKMELCTIEEGGTVRVYSRQKEEKMMCVEVEDVHDISETEHWFYHKEYLGCAIGTSIKIYSIKSGELIQEIQTEDGSEIQGVCTPCLGFLLVGYITNNSIHILQLSKKNNKVDMESMIKTEEFQTSAIHLAYLEQLKSVSPSTKVTEEITHLREVWNSGKTPICTKLAEIINPYLEEYWQLDKLQQNVLLGKLQQSLIPTSECGIEEEVLRVLSPDTSMTMSGRQAWLLVLSYMYPQKVLTILESQMDFDTEDISTSQIQRWQCILASDQAPSPVSSDVAVPVFEHICRLLYQINPAKLLHFVKISQMINDQKVGVSAFIRKRQAIQYYDRALTSIQDLHDQYVSKEAVTAYVELLLKSERNNCEVMAVQYYLRNEQWRLAIDLLAENVHNKELHSKLFNIILGSLNEGKVLSEFAEEIFQLMPDENFLSNVSSLIGDKESAHTSAFCQSSTDIPLSAIRPILIQKLCKKNVPV